MNRRHLLTALGAASLATPLFAQSSTQHGGQNRNLKPLILIELKGGNDGLNTWVPYANPAYYALRPSLAIASEKVLKLNPTHGLHPSMAEMKTLWDDNALAIVQGVGYAQANQSHFRSMDIWDTASNAQDTLQTGWLTRALGLLGAQNYAADAVLVGSNELGPARGGARAVTVSNPQGFAAQAKLASQTQRPLPGALAHVAKVENDIIGASVDIKPAAFQTQFVGAWAQVLRAASTVLVSKAAPVVRLTLGGFDTHRGQLGTHASLLGQLSAGLDTLKAAMTEHGLWQDALVLTYSEFGRRAAENGSQGTDHGTASVLFATGGRAVKGIYGTPMPLDNLAGGTLAHTVEFRRVYATVLSKHWGMSAAQVRQVLGAEFAPLGFVA